MSAFTTAELLGLPASDLRDLLELAPGESLGGRAAYLGLDLAAPTHLAAVQRACPELAEPVQPYSPPIGAAQAGVRSDRTPDELAPATPTEGHPVGVDDALRLPEPDPAAAAGLADMLAESAGTGQPFMGGTFALYADPSGAVVMVTETATGTRTDVIPRKAVKFALGLMSGKGTGMLGRMIGLG
jgi:hypothetical protein